MKIINEIMYWLGKRRISLYRPLHVGTAVVQWLRCCATYREVAGSIPAGVIEIFH